MLEREATSSIRRRKRRAEGAARQRGVAETAAAEQARSGDLSRSLSCQYERASWRGRGQPLTTALALSPLASTLSMGSRRYDSRTYVFLVLSRPCPALERASELLSPLCSPADDSLPVSTLVLAFHALVRLCATLTTSHELQTTPEQHHLLPRGPPLPGRIRPRVHQSVPLSRAQRPACAR